MTAQTMQIGNRPCRIYGEAHAEYLLLQMTGEHELQSMESEVTAIAQSAHHFLFAAIPVESWNDALSPWMESETFRLQVHLPSQHHLCVLQGLIIQQPVQLCPLCRGVAVLVLHGDAVDGKSGAILEPGFHPVGVHIEAAGKQFVHGEPHFYIKRCLFGCPKPCHRTDVSCKIVVWMKLKDFAQ